MKKHEIVYVAKYAPLDPLDEARNEIMKSANIPVNLRKRSFYVLRDRIVHLKYLKREIVTMFENIAKKERDCHLAVSEETTLKDLISFLNHRLIHHYQIYPEKSGEPKSGKEAGNE